MNSITISQDIYSEARNYANSRGVSLSALVEQYLQKLLHKHVDEAKENNSVLSILDKEITFKDLQGLLDDDMQGHREEALSKKYGI